MTLLLDVRHYETLVAIVERGTMTAAAESVSVSQSALSHRLNEAERRLGQPLFDRGRGRGLRPTPAGLALCQTLERVLPELQRAESDFLRTSGTVVDVVRLGIASYDCYHWFPSFHVYAREHAPDILLELVVVGGSPSTQLAGGAVDVVIAPGTPDPLFASEWLFRDELVLVTHPDHPLAGVDWINPDALGAENYLTYNRVPAPGFEYERFLRPSQTFPRTVTIIEQPGAIAQMVAADHGVSILSRWAMAPTIDGGQIAAVQCGQQPLALEWYALLRPFTSPSAPDQQVASLLSEWLRGTNPAVRVAGSA